MRPVVTYHELWLVSERDESARKLEFSPTKNLLAGANETGKSRILKHIVWALGCEPSTRLAGSWDSNLAASLVLTVGTRKLTFMRVGRDSRAAFDAAGQLIFASERASAWAEFFSETFKFPLKLQRHQEGLFALAGPEYAVLPFYIDQEGGWARKWGNFLRLSQFVRWEPVVFESFIGLRPQRYFDAQLTRDELVFKLSEARSEAKVQAKAFTHVRAMLPHTATRLNEVQFAKEMQEVSEEVATLSRDERVVRDKLFEVAQERHELNGQLQLALRAEQDLVEDVAYLSKYPDDEQLQCPTCGQTHGLSFRAKVELASDANEAHQLVLNVRARLEKLSKSESELRIQLTIVSSRMRGLETSLSVQPHAPGVADIVAAKSLATIELAYDQTRQQLNENIDELDRNRAALQIELDALTDDEHVKEVRAYYKAALKTAADRLYISKDEIGPIKVGARPATGAGSSGPRIYLAMHMALLNANAKYGSGPLFPFIVDTPRQQGLDDPNTARLLQAVYTHTAAKQIFIANESVPTDWTPPSDCKVQVFHEKRRFLRGDEYLEGVAALKPLAEAMADAIVKERAQATESEPTDRELDAGLIASEFEDDA